MSGRRKDEKIHAAIENAENEHLMAIKLMFSLVIPICHFIIYANIRSVHLTPLYMSIRYFV